MAALPSAFWEVVYFLCAFAGVSIICQKLRVTSVLGYLLSGFLLGPYGFSFFSHVEISQKIAEFGVVFLLFTIGLELPWRKLQELRRYVLVMGSFQVFVTTILFSAVAFYLGIPLTTSILIGVSLSFSSTAVILQILFDQKEVATRYGRICFSVLLFQDLSVIVFLTWLTMVRGESISFMCLLGWSVLKVSFVFLLFWGFARYFLRPLYHFISQTGGSDLFFAVTLLIIFVTSFTTESMGLSLGLGAFFSGFLLSETEYKHQIETDIRPFRALLLGLFFMTVGMTLNPKLAWAQSQLVVWLFLLMICAKAAIIIVGGLLMRINPKTSIRLGLILAGGSEFAFVVFKQAEIAGLVSNELVQIVYMNVVLSMMLTPLLFWLGNFICTRIGKELGFALKAAEEESADLKNHVIVVGFNKIGETVHELLSLKLIPHVIVELDVNKVAMGRLKKYPIFYGDARKADIFNAFHVERAKAVVITSDNLTFSSKLVTNLKNICPQLEIFVRAHEFDAARKLKKLGAKPIVPEVFAPSFELASAVFELFGLNKKEADLIVEQYRSGVDSSSEAENLGQAV